MAYVHNDAPANAVSTRNRNIDATWFEDQLDYLNSLNLDDFMTAAAYTLRSHSWIGPYQRTGSLGGVYTSAMVQQGHVSPLFPQMVRVVARLGPAATYSDKTGLANPRQLFADPRNALPARYIAFKKLLSGRHFSEQALREALEEYRADLKRIINASPPVRQPLVVYRGTRGDSFHGHVGRTYTSPAFSSAAFAVHHAMDYSKDSGNKPAALQRITLLPGARALLVAITNRWNQAGEYEVVLNEGAQYTFTGRGQLRWVLFKDLRETNPKLVQRRVTSVEVR